MEKIKDALEDDDPGRVQRRVDVARSNTWEARIRQLWNEIGIRDEE
ncbi:MAG: hypothetical protein IPL27_25295 [Lewinellaceae bacterium]|nr:hypothetical protein [Lewinellaceae bacterium]